MRNNYSQIKTTFSNNIKIIENYFFMTTLQIVNALFGILIYPYLIRVLGADSYGLYIFAFTFSLYFVSLISFGFNLPAMRMIVQNVYDIKQKNDIISGIFTAKILLAIISILLFIILTLFIPIIKQNLLIFVISFCQIIGEVLFPVWYFQAIQKMKIVTYIQLFFRIISLPFIFILIKSPADNWIYALITSSSIILGGIYSVLYLRWKENIYYKTVPLSQLKKYFKDSMPFFWNTFTSTIKQESVTILIGSFFGMKDVALFDLANKIILLPRMLTTSINGALFPKIIENVQQKVVKKVIKYETWVGLGVIVGVIFFGKWIILILGGRLMLDSYPLAIILSGTVLVWLVVGSYVNFIFIPNNKYYYVTRNQIVAFITFFLFCIPGILIFQNIMSIVAALTLSGFSEILYCKYLIKKHNLL
ncbi:MAG: oligosaccharide flippase family protein [Paludibacter sp.]|nr:oligosaccharide flippase family protein [Paludibacter sp.]